MMPPPPAPVRPGTAGFTLIELLVSLALLGLAAAMLLQGVQMAGIVVLRERGDTARLDEIVSAQRIIRGRIERIRPVTRLDSALPIVDVRGNDADFIFVAPPLDRAAPDALQRFLLVMTSARDLVLFRGNMRNGSIDRSGNDLAGWEPMTLMRNIDGLSIAYFGSGRTGGVRQWQTRWWNQREPPELVRVRVTFPRGDRRVWPDLVIRPRATVNAQCRVDALTGQCEVRE
jgi:general secretion pathway protein J